MASSTTPRKRPKKTDESEDTHDICAYIVFVSILKTGKKCQYFEIQVVSETQEKRVVCFNSDTHKQFIALLNEGVLFRNLVKSGEDYLYINKSSFLPSKPKFVLKRFPKPVMVLQDVVNKAPLYSRVTVRVKFTELEQSQTINSLSFVTGQVVDNSGEMRQLTLYNDLRHQVKVNKCYEITEVTVSTYMSKRVLKTSEQSTIRALPDAYIHFKTEETSTIMHRGKISNVVLSTLEASIHCPKCKSQCEADENVVICHQCGTVSSSAEAITKTDVQFTLAVADKRVNMVCDHVKIAQLVSVPIVNKVAFLKQLISLEVETKSHKLTGKISDIRLVEGDDGPNEDANSATDNNN